MTEGPSEVQPPTGGPQAPPPLDVESGTAWWKRWWVITLGVLILLVAVAAIAGGGGEDDSNAAELNQLREQVAELETENEELRAAADATEEPEAEEPEAEEPEAEEPEAEEPATTDAPMVDPAAPDGSPYAVAFGDIGVVSLPAGDPGVVAVVTAAAALDGSRSLPVIVRNNTASTVGQIEVTGTARDAAGTLVGSGSSQGFDPVLVEPGEIAWGYVYFGDIEGEGITFELSTSGEEPGFFLPVEITELNATDDNLVGGIINNLESEVSGPIGISGVCFATDGTLADTFSTFAEQDDLRQAVWGRSQRTFTGTHVRSGLLLPPGMNFKSLERAQT